MRKGFTLVEVALAVAVGLIIIGGAVAGYNAAKANADRERGGYSQDGETYRQDYRYTVVVSMGDYRDYFETNSYVREDGLVKFTDAKGRRHETPEVATHIREN